MTAQIDTPFFLNYADDSYDPRWRHIDGETLSADQVFEADVIIIGSGAGGGISAETLIDAGLSVLIIEEGPLRTAKDFKMREATAYADLYQETAARKTADKGISILQGRAVGGSTTVNWTSSFRTPTETLKFWAQEFSLKSCSEKDLAPHFDWAERRLNMSPWPVEPNANNAALARGCAALGWQHSVIARNVRGCANLGYCGLGCPMNAKQSMLVTSIPYALSKGATLLSRVRVERLVHDGAAVRYALAVPRDSHGQRRAGVKLELRARHFVLAGGAINTPALLLRSHLKNQNLRIGTRTFLHPVVISAAFFKEKIEAYSGAPQSIYSDEFVFKDGVDGRCGYKLEVPPIHPLIASTLLLSHDDSHREFMSQLPHLQATIALMRDGFHALSAGGKVGLDKFGDALLDYPVQEYLADGFRRALLTMAELQFAAGADAVRPVNKSAQSYSSWASAKAALTTMPMLPPEQQVFSAHVMGGCAFGEDRQRCVADSQGRLLGLANVSIHDGSLFPTSLGVNPQLSIYALVRKLSLSLGAELIGARSMTVDTGR